jgi:hypothetical protein
MEIQEININEIKPYKNNPREISNEAIEKVANSIKEFGNNQPIVVDQNNIIVVGHTRWKALKQLGKEKAFIIKKEFPKNKAIAYRIMDNRSGEQSKWENKLLKEELSVLSNEEFDLDLTGFDAEELDQYFFKDEKIIETNIDTSFDGSINDVKMVQLFFNPEDEIKFKTAVEKIQKKYNLENISDSVIKAVLNEADNC